METRGGQYELHDRIIIEISHPTGDHQDVVSFLALEISLEISADINRLHLPYFIPKTALVKLHENESCYLPDILVVNRPNLVNEPLWKKQSQLLRARQSLW